MLMYGVLDSDWLSEMNNCTELEIADSSAENNYFSDLFQACCFPARLHTSEF